MRPTSLAALALAVAGCTAAPTGPSAPFSLEPASRKVEMRQGEARAVDVAVAWAAAEREELSFAVALSPEGPHVRAKATRPEAEGPARVELSVSETAAPGDYAVTLTATGKSGAKAKATLTVTVPRGD